MRETENNFIIYNIDLPLPLFNNNEMLIKYPIDKITIDIVASYAFSLRDTPENNSERMEQLHRTYVQFLAVIKAKNIKNLPIIYEELNIP